MISDAEAKAGARTVGRMAKRLAQHEEDEMAQPEVQRVKQRRGAGVRSKGKRRSASLRA
jgi:hypothetical protein